MLICAVTQRNPSGFYTQLCSVHEIMLKIAICGTDEKTPWNMLSGYMVMMGVGSARGNHYTEKGAPPMDSKFAFHSLEAEGKSTMKTKLITIVAVAGLTVSALASPSNDEIRAKYEAERQRQEQEANASRARAEAERQRIESENRLNAIEAKQRQAEWDAAHRR